jgi:ADP-heptose:LPS heptosyltransferase
MVLGGWHDRAAADQVKMAAPRKRCIDLVGSEDLLVGYAALGRARLFIGNDSGVMHLAAAAGVPTLGLFGPSDESLYGPWGQTSRSVRGPRPFEAFLELDPTLSQALCHMTDLAVSQVLAAAEDLIRVTNPEAVHG